MVVSHMEPDHGANIAKLAALYPEMQVVGNAKTFLYKIGRASCRERV